MDSRKHPDPCPNPRVPQHERSCEPGSQGTKVPTEVVAKRKLLRRPSAGHAAVVYADRFPYDHVRDVIEVARLAQDTVILMLLAPQRRTLRRQVPDGDDLIWVSTEAALRTASAKGKVRKEGLLGVLAPALEQARRNGGTLRVVTDAAGHLCMIGRSSESHALEAMCGALCSDSGAKLLCIYPVEAFRLRGPRVEKEHHVVSHLEAERHRAQARASTR